LPEVVSVSRTNAPPLSGNDADSDLEIEGYTPPTGRPRVEGINFAIADSGYFDTLRIPILRGSAFADRDDGIPKAIVNETFVKRFWSGIEPLGKRVSSGSSTWEVIGVARDAKYTTIGETQRPYVYFPYRPAAQGFVLQIRTAGDPLQVVPGVQAVVRNLDSDLPTFDVRPMNTLLQFSLFPAQAAAGSLSLFGTIALILSAIGVYGVMAYLASCRVREIGLRIALGARPRAVLALILRRGIVITGTGVLIGLAGAIAGTRVLSRFLYDVSPTDPVTFASVTFVLWLVALAAMVIPALRAIRVDPVITLRHE
jgi:predicted permease